MPPVLIVLHSTATVKCKHTSIVGFRTSAHFKVVKLYSKATKHKELSLETGSHGMYDELHTVCV